MDGDEPFITPKRMEVYAPGLPSSLRDLFENGFVQCQISNRQLQSGILLIPKLAERELVAGLGLTGAGSERSRQARARGLVMRSFRGNTSTPFQIEASRYSIARLTDSWISSREWARVASTLAKARAVCSLIS